MSEKSFVLMRHGYTDNPSQKLDPEGIDDIKSTATQLIEQNIFPDIILHSPALKTKYTALTLLEAYEAAGQVLSLPIVKREDLINKRLPEELAALDDGYDTAFLISHEPSIQDGAERLRVKDEWHHRVGEASGFLIKTNSTSWKSLRPENVISAARIGFVPGR